MDIYRREKSGVRKLVPEAERARWHELRDVLIEMRLEIKKYGVVPTSYSGRIYRIQCAAATLTRENVERFSGGHRTR